MQCSAEAEQQEVDLPLQLPLPDVDVVKAVKDSAAEAAPHMGAGAVGEVAAQSERIAVLRHVGTQTRWKRVTVQNAGSPQPASSAIAFRNAGEVLDWVRAEGLTKYLLLAEQRLGHANGNNLEPNFSDIAENVSYKVETIYAKASIPSVSHTRVIQMIKAHHAKYIVMKRKINVKQMTKFIQEQRDKFVASAENKLFDIAYCKCEHFTSCTCPKEKKVPLIEQPFLLDQRNDRIGRIGKVDNVETKRLQKRNGRKSAESKKNVNYLEEVPLSFRHVPRKRSNDGADVNTERFGVSNTAAAAIVSCAYLDAQKAGLITAKDSARIVSDKFKIQRAKQNEVAKLQKQQVDKVEGLYFDGRRDKTMTQVKEGTKYHRRIIKEEHISLVSEPGSKYVGHVTPRSGTAEAECHAIVEYLQQKSVDITHLKVAGADGTSENTGWKGGVISKLEENLNLPLQWVICLLHFNELPFRALFEHIDGVSSSPNCERSSLS
ncbi:ATP-dependent DNA helicase mph1 [Frankliniella fusca]|uniref:ATP-dependent DNA helicase mph1 n=1 Tax=Frankliniella fusca TaxID=407009 RepID=A0AAE1L7K0_9NEOP|nr:ATP-dependent DNA helicase mph1 [Frankliniella fusca]